MEEMEYEFAEGTSARQPAQGASPFNIQLCSLFLHSDVSKEVPPGCELRHRITAQDEDVYSGKEEGEISANDGDSRAGDWEPNMEYGDTVLLDNNNYRYSWEVSNETSTSVQFKRQGDFSNNGLRAES
ncbi:hypothetical protein ONS95_006643 [Cadophora gregata]|uniref:uncharacterized protein n=1 Tax=Cadophora gregata TaxID=51156 RepID=UPI0026DB2B43|nr:uncharacterized protein ONS95_006643 [Cadophora gregata]KAK0101472.1 hypothetical protein ONS95_006643 [Cadophora gregata]